MVNYLEAELDAIFGALAHPIRRAMLSRLSHGGATVGELAAPFQLSAPAISRHLRVLESAGLLERRIDGRIHRIGLSPAPLREAMAWLEEHRRFWEPRLDRLVQYLESSTAKEESSWHRKNSARTSRFVSNARSRRRPRGSTRRGRKRKS
ncbi:MAG TPA: metalloregulator ArsR/SmtB family transcription factor [Candidatus Sulfotelmatobacter sp.]|nr:metalloregulator ArsR/SmtB family transcription factor [Candidatus Sulfotelmatobacter sp.]